MEKAVYTYLTSKSAITDLVGTRVYPHHLPQSNTVYPALTIQLIDSQHVHHLQGASGVATARVQIDCWSDMLSEVVTLAEAVRNAMQGFSGTMDGVNVHFIQLAGTRNVHEAPQDGSDNWTYRKTCDYMIKYTESLPSNI